MHFIGLNCIIVTAEKFSGVYYAAYSKKEQKFAKRKETKNMSQLYSLLVNTTDTPTAGGTDTVTMLLTTVLPIVLMIVIFYFLLIRPEKKRSKKMKEMLDNLQVADEVVTSGGIIGRVLSVKEDTVLIETGSDRTRLRVLRTAIIENRTVHDEVK